MKKKSIQDMKTPQELKNFFIIIGVIIFTVMAFSLFSFFKGSGWKTINIQGQVENEDDALRVVSDYRKSKGDPVSQSEYAYANKLDDMWIVTYDFQGTGKGKEYYLDVAGKRIKMIPVEIDRHYWDKFQNTEYYIEGKAVTKEEFLTKERELTMFREAPEEKKGFESFVQIHKARGSDGNVYEYSYGVVGEGVVQYRINTSARDIIKEFTGTYTMFPAKTPPGGKIYVLRIGVPKKNATLEILSGNTRQEILLRPEGKDGTIALHPVPPARDQSTLVTLTKDVSTPWQLKAIFHETFGAYDKDFRTGGLFVKQSSDPMMPIDNK